MEQWGKKDQVKSFFKVEEIMACLYGNHPATSRGKGCERVGENCWSCGFALERGWDLVDEYMCCRVCSSYVASVF